MKTVSNLVIGVLLCACSPSVSSDRYLTNTTAEQLVNNSSSGENSATVLFVCGGQVQKNALLGESTVKIPCQFSINGAKYEVLQHDSVAKLELKPGNYTFSPVEGAWDSTTVVPMNLTLSDKQRVLLISAYTLDIGMLKNNRVQTVQVVQDNFENLVSGRRPVSMRPMI